MKFNLIGLFFLVSVVGAFAQSINKQPFICPPCVCSSDEMEFDEIGKCPGCGMNLVGKIDPGEGYPYNNIYPGDVCNIASEDWVFLDVRSETEFNGELGHLKNAIHIHINELENRVKELEEFRNKNILVYCRMSIRSMRASQFLTERGFTNITNMLGGMNMWNDLSIEKLPCKEKLRLIE